MPTANRCLIQGQRQGRFIKAYINRFLAVLVSSAIRAISDLTKPLTEKCSDLDLSLLKTNLPAHARRHCSSSRLVWRACQHTGDSVSVVRHTCPSVQLTCTTSSSCNKHPDGLGKGDGHDGWSVQAFCVASRSRRSRKAHFHSVQALLKQVAARCNLWCRLLHSQFGMELGACDRHSSYFVSRV